MTIFGAVSSEERKITTRSYEASIKKAGVDDAQKLSLEMQIIHSVQFVPFSTCARKKTWLSLGSHVQLGWRSYCTSEAVKTKFGSK
jgi:hypothetical protein